MVLLPARTACEHKGWYPSPGLEMSSGGSGSGVAQTHHNNDGIRGRHVLLRLLEASHRRLFRLYGARRPKGGTVPVGEETATKDQAKTEPGVGCGNHAAGQGARGNDHQIRTQVLRASRQEFFQRRLLALGGCARGWNASDEDLCTQGLRSEFCRHSQICPVDRQLGRLRDGNRVVDHVRHNRDDDRLLEGDNIDRADIQRRVDAVGGWPDLHQDRQLASQAHDVFDREKVSRPEQQVLRVILGTSPDEHLREGPDSETQ